MPDRDPANAEQARKVADVLFDAWSERQEREGKTRSRWAASIPAWVACGLSLATVIWQASTTTNRVADNTRRIIQLEADARADAPALARIEAKVDLLMDERKKQ